MPVVSVALPVELPELAPPSVVDLSSSADAHIGAKPLYVSYAAELTALIGENCYDELTRLCAARLEKGLVAEHPATTAARQKSNL